MEKKGLLMMNLYASCAQLCLGLLTAMLGVTTTAQTCAAQSPILLIEDGYDTPDSHAVRFGAPYSVYIGGDPHGDVLSSEEHVVAQAFTKLEHRLFDPSGSVHSGSGARVRDLIQIGAPGIIRPPTDRQQYDAWLAAMHAYRKSVLGINQERDSEKELLYTIRFHGQGGSWLRLNERLSQALKLGSGEQLTWRLDARAKTDGNGTFYLAFDIHDHQGRKMGWSDLDACPVTVPQDGTWHTVTVTATVPEFDKDQAWMRPIFGMDQVCDPTPGEIELRSFELLVNDTSRIRTIRDAGAESARLDMSLYDREDLKWLATSFSYHFTFLYDLSFYDPQSGQYTIDKFLADGEREFGGYDAVLLWQAYPRIGFDERNQFDFYRDMPGGMDGLRQLVDKLHQRGLKVHIDYNPWDRATRREQVSDAKALADLVVAMDCDGIFLDTLSSGSSDLRLEVDRRRKGVVLVPELYPRVEDLSFLMGSWYQFGTNPFPEPGILQHKWIEPRHMEYQISRWKGHGEQRHLTHYQEIENAYFNGSGMTVWENIFGTYNPWPAEDRMLWSHAVRILRTYAKHFTGGDWQPYYPTEHDSLYANRFTLDRETLFTLVNHGRPLDDAHLLSVSLPASNGRPKAYDLWNGRELELVEAEENRHEVIGSVDRLGGILITTARRTDTKLAELLQTQRRQDWTARLANDTRNSQESVAHPVPVLPTPRLSVDAKPEGMVFVPETEITMNLSHKTIECGCYPDPEVDPSEWESRFFKMGQVEHRIGPLTVGPFFIDETEVTNAQFKTFLDATDYQPKEPKNFLKHWPNGEMPEGLADHPVVYIDLDDARAYAAWSGKRLPREEEWHLAAQGTNGRKWPWGNDDPTPEHVNRTGTHTMPVRSCPDGRSPYGCYHMSGNVYEWTESQRSDGHTRFAILRGGSYFDPHADPGTSSIWYNDGGPRPCTHHAKFILMYPGLDRCATIGFRCVKDVVTSDLKPLSSHGS